MKKLLILSLLALALVVTAVACGGGNTTDDTTADTTVTDAATEAGTVADTTVADTNAAEADTTAGTAADDTAAGETVAADDTAADDTAVEEGTAAEADTTAGTEATTEAGAETTDETEIETEAETEVETEAETEDNAVRVDLSEVSYTGSYTADKLPGLGIPSGFNPNGSFPGDSGMCAALHANAGDITPALTADDTMIILHYGTISLGEVDLSQYSKVVVTYATPAGADYASQYDATQKRVMLLNAPSTNNDNPIFEDVANADAIIASSTYEMSAETGLLTTVEIDLATIDFNGETYLTFDFRTAENAIGATSYLIYLTGIAFYA